MIRTIIIIIEWSKIILYLAFIPSYRPIARTRKIHKTLILQWPSNSPDITYIIIFC